MVNGAAGAVIGDSDTAATFSGTSAGTAYAANSATTTTNFSEETWFKTTTKTGGQLLGLATSQTGTNGADDRRLYMDNAGHLLYGINSGQYQTVASPATYNDGAWHQAVVTQSLAGASLYVDGALVSRNALETSPQRYDGYWRLGGESLSGWPSAPTSSYFAGTLDETAIYPTVLSASTIQAHVTKSGRTPAASTTPTAAFTSSCTNLTCSFDASGSSAASGATITGYSWAFGDSTTGTGATTSHTYTAAGTKTVTMTVSDSKGGTDTVTHTVSPAAATPPTASFAYSCTNLSCSFDASASSAANGATVTGYAWKFGDTATGTGAKPAHAYTSAGSYTVTLTVTDSNNQTSTATKTVTVTAPPAPTAAFTSSCTNLACTFDATGSSAAGGATITSYAWTFGDSSSGTGAKPSHSYTKANTYTVALTVLDSNNQKSTVSHTVTVTAPTSAPTASFTSSCTQLACSFDGSASKAVSGATIKSYAWNLGDKATGTGAKLSHTYAAAGTYTVILTVTDSANRTGTATKAVTVAAAVAPVAADAFGRSVTNGWGTADTGGAWSVDQPELYSVANGTGQIALTGPGAGAAASLSNVSAANLNVTFDLGMSKAPTGNGLLATLSTRQTSNGEYRFKVHFLADGSVHLVVAKDTTAEGETVIQEVVVPGLTYTAGTLLHARLQISGSGTTTIAGKVWSGSTEPAASQISVTDNEATLQSAGGIGVLVYLAGNATNAPVSVLFDNLQAIKS
ncbi:PKD domain-containing protein [uncultured Jatrophihabitans sp.]|uniref:PKD domain-containing protein n=1 Tax=uncultured Jatrophihabitans sp. TaxID=1610747 RepID=UPI0035CA7CDA